MFITRLDDWQGTGVGEAQLLFDRTQRRVCLTISTYEDLGSWTEGRLGGPEATLAPFRFSHERGGEHQRCVPEPADVGTQIAAIKAQPQAYTITFDTTTFPDGDFKGRLIEVRPPPTEVLANPVRVYDSRAGGGIHAAGGTEIVEVVVPDGTSAAVVTITADQTAGPGFLAAHAAGTPPPATSTLNWHLAGQSIATTATVAVDDQGRLAITMGPSDAHVIIDVVGYVADPTGSVDSRDVRRFHTLLHGSGGTFGVATLTFNLATSEVCVSVMGAFTGTSDRAQASVLNSGGAAQLLVPLQVLDVAHAEGCIALTSELSALLDALGQGPQLYTLDVEYESVDEVGVLQPGGAYETQMLEAPRRAYDSRNDDAGPVAPGGARTIDLGLPAEASAALVTITADRTTGAGFLAAAAAGSAPPPTSDLNWYEPGQVVATNTTVAVDDQGRIGIAVGQSSADVIVDVVGYLTGSDLDVVSGTALLPQPQRVHDSRSDAAGILAPSATRTIDLDVPEGTIGAIVTVTADQTAGAGYLAMHAAGVPAPATSSLNWHRPGAVGATSTVVAVDEEGRIAVTNGPAATHVIVDVTGYLRCVADCAAGIA